MKRKVSRAGPGVRLPRRAALEVRAVDNSIHNHFVRSEIGDAYEPATCCDCDTVGEGCGLPLRVHTTAHVVDERRRRFDLPALVER